VEQSLAIVAAAMGGVNIAIGTTVQLAIKDLFGRNSQGKTQFVLTLRHLKKRRILDEILPIFFSILEYELHFDQVHVQKVGKKKIFGLDYGLYYIKPQSIH